MLEQIPDYKEISKNYSEKLRVAGEKGRNGENCYKGNQFSNDICRDFTNYKKNYISGLIKFH